MELLELSRSLKLERDRRERNSCPLLDEILEDMEDTPQIELQANIKKFQREIKFNVDAHTVVGYKYKDAERLRTAGKAVTEIFQDIKFVIDRGGSEEHFQKLSEILEKVRRLSVYGYVRGKKCVRYLEDEDDEDKDMAFDVETVERIQQARYEEAILRRATSRGQQRG
ncbi:hypothetical protein G6F70_007398 [Rhizopus microsporus]|nr:hypothetical protein G6F71_007383 [Rhizopus microsporus]KAG1196502.1 hypothetical protein G6F70_007398 [Rhizopus microsporus]KAG1208237.1 hypothetical protein G6F69_007389 [Rhizopus microsporus]KAG1229517.1 hypothetical protein G6F67_007092 [Rhizopus microsporus]KAG1261418.1 hypothetical protein G6F68_006698 [Rhizopus microsporus]